MVVSERITPEFGVVAIDGSHVVDGKRLRDVTMPLRLRLEGSKWKLELNGPVHVRPIGPDPGAHEQVVAQVAAAVSGEGGAGSAVFYVDGLTENPKIYGTQRNSTLVVNIRPGARSRTAHGGRIRDSRRRRLRHRLVGSRRRRSRAARSP